MNTESGHSEKNPIDSKVDWIAEHIKGFDEPDGSGWPRNRGAPLLLLTTKGAKTGLWRRTALIFGKDGDRFLVVASKGGHPNPPSWYVNLETNPKVWVQVEDKKFYAIARTATPEKKPRLWNGLVKLWPDFANYQKRTERDIPVVILEPVE